VGVLSRRCTTFGNADTLDNVVVVTNTSEADLTGWEKIDGELQIKQRSNRNPELREVHGGQALNFKTNLMPELHLPRLESANAILNISQNAVLTNIVLPRLTYAAALDICHSPRLLNFTDKVARRIDRVYLEGNFINVEFFSLKEVTGDSG
jgi:hypothetical protein